MNGKILEIIKFLILLMIKKKINFLRWNHILITNLIVVQGIFLLL